MHLKGKLGLRQAVTGAQVWRPMLRSSKPLAVVGVADNDQGASGTRTLVGTVDGTGTLTIELRKWAQLKRPMVHGNAAAALATLGRQDRFGKCDDHRWTEPGHRNDVAAHRTRHSYASPRCRVRRNSQPTAPVRRAAVVSEMYPHVSAAVLLSSGGWVRYPAPRAER